MQPHRRSPDHDGGDVSTMEIHSSTHQTYPQDWPAYNLAQTSEKDTFMALLADLCANILQPEYSFGRPRLPLADMVYTGALKVYTGFSARRFDCDVRQASRQGLISAPPTFTTVNKYISNPDYWLEPGIIDEHRQE